MPLSGLGYFFFSFCLDRLESLIFVKTAIKVIVDRDLSENSGTPKSSILIGFSSINHPFWGTPIVGNTHVLLGWPEVAEGCGH